MLEFKLISQKEIEGHCQGINLSEFTYSNDGKISEAKLIDFFIHSSSFKEESRKERIKNHTGDCPYLRQAFEIDLVKLSDFKKFDKSGVIQFLNNFVELNESRAKDATVERTNYDKAVFSSLKDTFLESLKDVESDSFYIISKKWFNRDDKRVRQVEHDNFVYYFLIIWTNVMNKTLTVSEWTFD